MQSLTIGLCVQAHDGVGAESGAQRELISSQVLVTIRKLLGRNVEPHTPLMEAGLDSLGAVELRSSLAISFDTELPATLAYDYPTAAALSDFIASQIVAAGANMVPTGEL